MIPARDREQSTERGPVTPTLLFSIRGLSWGYLILAVMLWLAMLIAGDHWWPATLVLFGPHWLMLLPLLVLFPLAAWKNRRMILPLVAALIIVIGPIMGFTLPLDKARPSSGHLLRIISCNLQNGTFDLPAFNALIENSRPDIVALQECPANQKIKALEGWNHLCEGDLHIFSRFPVIRGDFRKALVPLHSWPRTCFLYCTLSTPAGNLTFATVHLPSPRYGLQNILDRTTLVSLQRKTQLIDETAYRRKTSEDIAGIVALLPSPKIIAGDFNMPVESVIYRQVWSGYSNAFSRVGLGFGRTERANIHGLALAVRIDHILTGEGLVPQICEVGPDVGSDHLPVIADVARSML